MAGIKVSPFGGLVPKVGTRLLPDNAAVQANNVKLQSGELRPLRAPYTVNTPMNVLPPESIYLARYGEASAWMTWGFDVDAVRVPLPSDVETRIVWTGDGAPKMATFTKLTTGGLNNYPSDAFTLGIPNPQSKPSVTSSLAGIAVRSLKTRPTNAALAYTQDSDSVDSLVTLDTADTGAHLYVRITQDNNSTSAAYTGDPEAEFSGTTTVYMETFEKHKLLAGVDVTLTGFSPSYYNGTFEDIEIVDEYTISFRIPAVVLEAASTLGTYTHEGFEQAVTRFYGYTYFSELGEESGISPLSDIHTGRLDANWYISGMDEMPANSGTGTASFSAGKTTFANTGKHWLRVGDQIGIGGDPDAVVTDVVDASTFKVEGDFSSETEWERTYPWNTANMKRRLYRTTGSTGSFQLVSDDVGTSYTDTLSDSEILGDELISADWQPPPVGLKGVVVHPSGSIVGFVGTVLYQSVPYQPHAFVQAYQRSTDYEIVGLAVYGTEIGIATKGNPYVASGVEPESLTLNKIEQGSFPCLSKRSVASVGDGFIFATAHGMALIGTTGVSVFTDKFFTYDEWRNYYPQTIVTAIAYGRVYLSYTRPDESRAILIIDGDTMVTADVVANELYTDVGSGELYIGNENGVQQWDSELSFPLQNNWRSKDYTFSKPVNFGAAKIDFDIAIDPDEAALIQAEIDQVIAENAALMTTGNVRGYMNAKPFAGGSAVNGSDLVKPPEIPPSNTITFILRDNNGIVISRPVTTANAFKLPAGYKSDTFSVEVLGQCNIREIRVAETMQGLSAL